MSQVFLSHESRCIKSNNELQKIFNLEFPLEINSHITQDLAQKDSINAILNFTRKMKLCNIVKKIKF